MRSTKKDLDAVMAFYVDDKDAVFYEDTVPFQLKSASRLREIDEEFFKTASDGPSEVWNAVEFYERC
jgi:ketosteroid isomerase-like protein